MFTNILHVLTEQRNCEILILLQIYKNYQKNQIYVDMYAIEDILKTSTQNGNEVVTLIAHMMYERKEGSF